MELEKIKHSLSHILAASVKELFPNAKFGIGPAIENGFYYDIEANFKEEDLPKIEKKMKEIIKKDISFIKKDITKKEAKELFKDQSYKLELIEEIPEEKVSIYTSGDFIDLCKGPHIKSTKEINTKAFKLQKLAGAYWRGDEKNNMLTRIYGLAFETEEKLNEYLKMLEEAEKRDHRKLGRELDLFSFHEVAPGMPFFHPKGTIVYNELKKLWIDSQKEFDYEMVICPSMMDVSIWKKSGHWDHYKDDMYFTHTEGDQTQYALRPMDCPGAIIIYNNSPKSYRDFPLRYAEPGLITRREKSGQLGGLFRVQQFVQDDAHIFIREDQIEEEIKNVIALVNKIYNKFGLEYKAFLSTRPDSFMGDPNIWEKAENDLKKILNDVYGKNNYGLKEKDGAFYGPKIDFQLKDCLGRTWQCATIQLDFQMPLKFNCVYADSDGNEKNPVLIHRTIMGSFERFMGILIEHYAGAFPFWLAPVQIKILPVGESHREYAKAVAEKLKEYRIKIDDNNETIGKKIRNAEMEKVPYVLVVGDVEKGNNTISVRQRGKIDLGEISIEEFIKKLNN
ncbi:MAG TPA: threonine--tRNA ligase [Candidatus Pacearchaeota archaeon]|nr:threonine--tRNA ligase [Candidatus Pacearchaeota archaeon]HPR80138.1 threonine--tRNA ligase [Candidatus Pacearchaeota archaeon]